MRYRDRDWQQHLESLCFVAKITCHCQQRRRGCLSSLLDRPYSPFCPVEILEKVSTSSATRTYVALLTILSGLSLSYRYYSSTPPLDTGWQKLLHRCLITPNLIIGIPYSSLIVGVPRELFPNERRVALTPENAALLKKKGVLKVLVERNAGAEAQFLDEQYAAAGAALVTREELFSQSDIMLKVRPPLLEEEAKHIKHGSTVISFLYPTQNKALVELLAARGVNRCVELFHRFGLS